MYGSSPPNSHQNEKCFRKISRENEKMHFFMFNNFFSLKITPFWDNVGTYDIARHAIHDSMIWRMCFACWITKATNTHLECIILNAFLQWQWFDSLLQCMYIACLDWIAAYVLRSCLLQHRHTLQSNFYKVPSLLWKSSNCVLQETRCANKIRFLCLINSNMYQELVEA